MARSNRPELVKDNPPAPQMYVRRRNKGRTRRSLGAVEAGERDTVRHTLHRLAAAAEAFLEAAPQWKRAASARQTLEDALFHAQLVLSSDKTAVERPVRPSRDV
jgi:hypothetical protein